MRRLPRTERTLLWGLTPLWFLCAALHLDRQLGDPPLAWVPLYVAPAADAAKYPEVVGYWPETPPEEQRLAPGDRLLAIGGEDAAGIGHFRLWEAMFAHAPQDLRVPVTAERDGARLESTVQLRSMPFAWQTVPLSLALGLSALLALHRGRGSPAARAYALGAIAYSLQWSFLFGGTRWETHAGLALFFAAGALYQPLTLRAGLMFPDDVAVRARWPYTLCWVFSLTALGLWAWLFGAPISGDAGLRLLGASYSVWIAVFLAVLIRNYRRADGRGRRQLKWVLYGFALGLGPVAVGAVVFGARPDLRWVYEGSLTATVFIPICLYIAFIRYNLYDINRLITTTVAYTILAPVLLGALFSVGLPVAEWASGALGLRRETVLWVLAFAMAAPAPWLGQRLRPQIERIFFRKQFELERGIRELRARIPSFDGPGELLASVGAELARLLQLESLAIYARGGAAFAPVFGAGPTLPPGFDASGALCALLEDLRGPADSARIARWLRMPTFSAVDRAALESLGVEAILPLHREEALDAFVCLGDKSSGDVFTRAELAQLEGLAERISVQLARFDEEKLLADQRSLWEKLASYAPGTVREEIARGADIAPGEREVSVLFIDIRGYTTFSETRDAGEIFRVVNAYTTAVSGVIREHGGSVVEFHGDGLMAAFGAPGDLPDKERAAVEAARAAVKVVESGHIAELGDIRLGVGVGIATGMGFVGEIQSVDRKIWAVIGNTTNFAARLQSLSRELEASVVIDDTTWRRAGPSATGFREHADVRIKGRTGAFLIHALPWRALG